MFSYGRWNIREGDAESRMKILKYVPNNLINFILDNKLCYAMAGTLISIVRPFPYKKWMTKNQVIFIHIPKCAGTSVLKSLGGGEYRSHYPYYIYKEANSFKYKKYYKFAFVRNPIDRTMSTYKYLKRGGNGREDLLLSKQMESLDFDSFVRDWLTVDRVSSIRMLMPQTSFIYNHFTNKVEVDFVGRVESFKDDIRHICNVLNLDCTVHLENVSCDGDNDYISESARRRIYDLYEQDFKRLGYCL